MTFDLAVYPDVAYVRLDGIYATQQQAQDAIAVRELLASMAPR